MYLDSLYKIRYNQYLKENEMFSWYLNRYATVMFSLNILRSCFSISGAVGLLTHGTMEKGGTGFNPGANHIPCSGAGAAADIQTAMVSDPVAVLFPSGACCTANAAPGLMFC